MLEHKTISLSDQVFEKLEQDILSGVYERGEIINESRLSTELGVSRTPIREALHRLMQEHIIEEVGKGYEIIGITESDLEEIFTIRRYVEGVASKRAALNHTEEQLAQLKEAIDLQEFYYNKNDSVQIKNMDNLFHSRVYEIAGRMFYDTLIPLHKKVQKYRQASVKNHTRAQYSVQEHRDIYNAIASGDGDMAEKLTRIHIENAYKHITEEQ